MRQDDQRIALIAGVIFTLAVAAAMLCMGFSALPFAGRGGPLASIPILIWLVIGGSLLVLLWAVLEGRAPRE